TSATRSCAVSSPTTTDIRRTSGPSSASSRACGRSRCSSCCRRGAGPPRPATDPERSARAAAVARRGVAGRRLEPGERLPTLREEVALVDAVVDEVPREERVRPELAVDESIGVDDAVPARAERAQRGPPLVRPRVQPLEDGGHAAVAAREQRLEVRRARALRLDLDARDGAERLPQPAELAAEHPQVLHRLPLEGRPGL